MQFTKQFIFIYAIFTILLLMFQVSGVSNNGFHEIVKPNKFNLSGIITFVSDVALFILSLITFTISNPTKSVFILLVNGFLWSYRTLVVIELLPYVRDLFKV